MFPYLIDDSAFAVKTYYLFAVLGIFAGFISLFFFMRGFSASKKKKIYWFALLIFVPFFIGARLGPLIEQFLFRNPPPCSSSMFFGILGPVSLWWGLLLATACSFYVAKRLKTDVWDTADLFAPSIAIGGFFMKIGCFMNGCCAGIKAPSDFPFSVTFPSFPYDAAQDFPVYPSQVFESLSWLIIFIVLALRFKYKRFTGEIFLIMSILFCFFRFINEFTRNDFLVNFLSVAQYLSIVFGILALVLYVVKSKTQKNKKTK